MLRPLVNCVGVLFSDNRKEGHYHLTATHNKKRISDKMKKKIVPTGCSTAMRPHTENELCK